MIAAKLFWTATICMFTFYWAFKRVDRKESLMAGKETTAGVLALLTGVSAIVLFGTVMYFIWTTPSVTTVANQISVFWHRSVSA